MFCKESQFVVPYSFLIFLSMIESSSDGHLVVDHLGVHAFVENEHERVVLRDGCAKDALEEPVCAYRLLDVPSQPVLRDQFRWLKPAHIVGVVEEVLDDCDSLSHPER